MQPFRHVVLNPSESIKKYLDLDDDIGNASYVEDWPMTRTRTTFNIVLHFRVEGGWRSKRGSGGECAMCYLYMQWCGEFDRIERHWREVSQHRRVGGWVATVPCCLHIQWDSWPYVRLGVHGSCHFGSSLMSQLSC